MWRVIIIQMQWFFVELNPCYLSYSNFKNKVTLINQDMSITLEMNIW